MDGGHAGRALEVDRREHRADRQGSAAAQPDRPGIVKGAMSPPPQRWLTRLPFYYGWVIVGITFVTMAVSVSARTAFSLLLPPLVSEFGWDRGLAAGAFSFGFLVSAVISPIVG